MDILFKLLWPFVNETVLKNKPLREFIGANKLVLFLLFLNGLTGLSCLYLYSVVNKVSNRGHENTRLIERLNFALAQQADRLIEANSSKIRLESQNRQLNEANLELLIKIEQYETWLTRCGIDLQGGINQRLRCNITLNATPARSNRPSTQPPHNRDRVRDIFDQDK